MSIKDFIKYLSDVSKSSIREIDKQDIFYEIVDFILIIITVIFYTWLNLSNINLAITILLLVCNRNMRKFRRN